MTEVNRLIPTLTETQRNELAKIFDRGAEAASEALSRWLGRSVRLVLGAIEQVELEAASELLGPGDDLVAACAMELLGGLTGQLILVFQDRSGLALVDMLLGQTPGTTRSWGDLEQSAAKETANIVGCAYLNALAAHLPSTDANPLVPSPPAFRHEFAANLLEFALMDQALRGDRLLLMNSGFSADGLELAWTLLFVPSGDSLMFLCESLGSSDSDLS